MIKQKVYEKEIYESETNNMYLQTSNNLSFYNKLVDREDLLEYLLLFLNNHVNFEIKSRTAGAEPPCQ